MVLKGHVVSSVFCDLPLATCDLRLAACRLPLAACRLRLATCDLRPATCDLRLATCYLRLAETRHVESTCLAEKPLELEKLNIAFRFEAI